MRYFFYNSFTLGRGYAYTELKNNEICKTDMSIDLDCAFSNGGCQLLLKQIEEKSILVVKGIEYVNNNKKFDEQGRKVSINFAIEASKEEHDRLTNIFFGIIAEWKNFSKYMGEAIIIPYASNQYGYSVNQECIEALIDYLSDSDTEKTKEKLEFNQKNPDIIVLKGNDYNYYVGLNKDLYSAYRIKFKQNTPNIISGEQFTECTNETGNEIYDNFVQKVNEKKKKVAVEQADNNVQTDTNIEAAADTVNEIIHTEPTPTVVKADEATEQETTKIPVEQNGNDGNEDTQTKLTTTDKNENETKEDIGRYIYKIIKSHSKFILGLACGLLLGYLIWK